MAKRSRMSDSSVARVAEQALPGWKAVNVTSLEQTGVAARSEASADAPPSAADAVLPSQAELRAKYLGARDSAVEADALDAADAADTALVELEAGPLKKTVAISKSKKKVLWSQG